MKTRKIIGVAVLMALSLTAGYWLGYQHGSKPVVMRLNMPSKLKQVGLSFRLGRNDVSDRVLQDRTNEVETPVRGEELK